MQLEGEGERSAGEVVSVLKLGVGVWQQPVQSVEQQASKEKIHTCTIHLKEL